MSDDPMVWVPATGRFAVLSWTGIEPEDVPAAVVAGTLALPEVGGLNLHYGAGSPVPPPVVSVTPDAGDDMILDLEWDAGAAAATRVTVYWGDGASESINVADSVAGGSHEYSLPGIYTVSGISDLGQSFATTLPVPAP